MWYLVRLVIVSFMMVVLISPAFALTVNRVLIREGEVQVKGTDAVPNADILWEGQVVTQATGRGKFSFGTTILPPDCVGDLSDGIESIEVVIPSCGPQGPPGPPGGALDITTTIVGTWIVENVGTGATGQVTFNSNGTYTIDSGTYNAGGTWFGATSGTYKVVVGSVITFTYSNWTLPLPVSRIAIVQHASSNKMVHFAMGHTHDLEILTQVP